MRWQVLAFYIFMVMTVRAGYSEVAESEVGKSSQGGIYILEEGNIPRPQPRPENLKTTGRSSSPPPTNYNLSVQRYARAAKRGASECSRFIKSDGSYGSYGVELLKAIDSGRTGYENCFYNNIDFSRLCPNYSRLSVQRKRQFLVFMFGAIAIEESTCRPNSTNGAATNGRADGLFMLEYSSRLRKGSGRPAPCLPGVPANTQDVGFQMRCTVAIFKQHYCDHKMTPGRSSGYWQPFNGLNRKSSKIARQFPYCN